MRIDKEMSRAPKIDIALLITAFWTTFENSSSGVLTSSLPVSPNVSPSYAEVPITDSFGTFQGRRAVS